MGLALKRMRDQLTYAMFGAILGLSENSYESKVIMNYNFIFISCKFALWGVLKNECTKNLLTKKTAKFSARKFLNRVKLLNLNNCDK